jgi:hypothetical protein
MQTKTIFMNNYKSKIMKKIFSQTLIAAACFLSILLIAVPQKAHCAFPIDKASAAKVEKEHAIAQEQFVQAEKKQQAKSHTASKSSNSSNGDQGIYGIVSIALGVLGWSTSGLGFGFLLLLGAFITGIIGVNRKRKYKGLALTGLILGALGILIFLFAVLIFASLVL